jgi:putative membrane protein
MTRWAKSVAFRVAIVAAVVLGAAFAVTTAVSAAYESADSDLAQATVGLHAPRHTVPAPDASDRAGALGVMTNGDDDHDCGMGDWDLDGGWWIVMPIMMVIFWGGIIAVAVWGIRQFTRGREQRGSPLDIAKERLARGEITKEEFDELRRDLS